MPPDPKTMPKATVKLNQTVPMSTPKPAPALKTADFTTTEIPEEDSMMLPLSIAALVAAIFAVITAFIAG